MCAFPACSSIALPSPSRNTTPKTFAEQFNAGYVLPRDNDNFPYLPPMPLDERRLISARACDELPANAIVNLGIGMPEGIAKIAAERNLLGHFTLTVESGPIGGIPAQRPKLWRLAPSRRNCRPACPNSISTMDVDWILRPSVRPKSTGWAM